MATFTTCIRNKNSNGFYMVYIRLAHKGEKQYINTGLVVSEKGLRTYYDEKGKPKKDVSDRFVQSQCSSRINHYIEKLNRVNANDMDCKSLMEYLTQKEEDISFSKFAKEYIDKIYNQDRNNTGDGYTLAVNSLTKFVGKQDILFRDLKSSVIYQWIDSMKDSSRKRNLYPTYIRAIFRDALKRKNDYDADLIRIKTNPFATIDIPKSKKGDKRSVSAYIIKKVLTSEVKKPVYDGLTRIELSQDVGNLIFSLAGINAADLYDLKKISLKKDWKICYNRKKTRDKSDSGAYIEIIVPERIRHLFKKYKGKKDHLFSFSERYSNPNDFARNVNKGFKRICEALEIEAITTYTFRHSWATIAQNDCGGIIEHIALAMGHSSGHKITEGYIRKDYTPASVLNNKVIKRVFETKYTNKSRIHLAIQARKTRSKK